MDNAEADAAAAAGIRTSKDDGSWPADIRRAVAGGSAAPCTRRGADRAEAPWRPAAARHRASAPAPVRLPRASTTAFSAASQRSVYQQRVTSIASRWSRLGWASVSGAAWWRDPHPRFHQSHCCSALSDQILGLGCSEWTSAVALTEEGNLDAAVAVIHEVAYAVDVASLGLGTSHLVHSRPQDWARPVAGIEVAGSRPVHILDVTRRAVVNSALRAGQAAADTFEGKHLEGHKLPGVVGVLLALQRRKEVLRIPEVVLNFYMDCFEDCRVA